MVIVSSEALCGICAERCVWVKFRLIPNQLFAWNGALLVVLHEVCKYSNIHVIDGPGRPYRSKLLQTDCLRPSPASLYLGHD